MEAITRGFCVNSKSRVCFKDDGMDRVFTLDLMLMMGV